MAHINLLPWRDERRKQQQQRCKQRLNDHGTTVSSHGYLLDGTAGSAGILESA